MGNFNHIPPPSPNPQAYARAIMGQPQGQAGGGKGMQPPTPQINQNFQHPGNQRFPVMGMPPKPRF